MGFLFVEKLYHVIIAEKVGFVNPLPVFVASGVSSMQKAPSLSPEGAFFLPLSQSRLVPILKHQLDDLAVGLAHADLADIADTAYRLLGFFL